MVKRKGARKLIHDNQRQNAIKEFIQNNPFANLKQIKGKIKFFDYQTID
jgi:hypothetical protein